MKFREYIEQEKKSFIPVGIILILGSFLLPVFLNKKFDMETFLYWIPSSFIGTFALGFLVFLFVYKEEK
ncbi:MAG: hypothetical protein WC758_07990 [Candidatus Woesearchaeota archaeon]|jgi:peptidoglycan/LPS O-acetylase OafA/YrhL